jgi:hypothetical protein
MPEPCRPERLRPAPNNTRARALQATGAMLSAARQASHAAERERVAVEQEVARLRDLMRSFQNSVTAVRARSAGRACMCVRARMRCVLAHLRSCEVPNVLGRQPLTATHAACAGAGRAGGRGAVMPPPFTQQAAAADGDRSGSADRS